MHSYALFHDDKWQIGDVDVLASKRFPRLWVLCWEPPVMSEFPTQKASNVGFGGLLIISLNKVLDKQSSVGDLR